MDKDTKKLLEMKFGKEDAKQIIKMQTKCDKFLNKFKEDMNVLLKSYDLEVLCGVAYKEITKQTEQ